MQENKLVWPAEQSLASFDLDDFLKESNSKSAVDPVTPKTIIPNGSIKNPSNQSPKIQDTCSPLKRPVPSGATSYLIPSKRPRISDVKFKDKNPISILYELCGASSVKFLELGVSGPSHAPEFEFQCLPNPEVHSPMLASLPADKMFTGKGSNKQKAKYSASLSMLNAIVQSERGVLPNLDSREMNFTSDTLEGRGSIDFLALKKSNSNVSLCNSSPISNSVEKSPAQMLYELNPDCKSNVRQVVEPNSGLISFKATVTIDNENYQGEGRSKKIAKQNAASVVLHQKYNVDMRYGSSNDLPGLLNSETSSTECNKQSRAFADRVQAKLKAVFCEQASRVNEQFSRRKVIAGIVITRPDHSSDTEETEEKVLCVTTGTKCLSGSCLNGSGEALNDCHAEVLSRRCLQRYLYLQILSLQGEKPLPKDEWIILEPIFKDKVKKFRLKGGVKFHLYVSSAPCGDSRIFLPQNDSSSQLDCSDDHPQRRNRSLLRTKIESGEGTIPITSSYGIQTWDGVVAGERLLTMSCSDKVCLWNCLGLQGALLMSLLTEPVYLSSLILGSLFQKPHLQRAVFSRAEDAGFPSEAMFLGLKPTCPDLLTVTSQDERTAGKSPNFSVNWLCVEPATVEVIISAKGQTEANEPSRLCKREMFRLYASTSCAKSNVSHNDLNYSDAKSSNSDSLLYMTCKVALHKHFKDSGLGTWVSRPMEEEMFSL